MNHLSMKSSKIFVRTVALFMTFAMFSTLILSIPMTSEAKAVKVSSVKVFSKTLVLKSGASMKLKPTVKVSPNKNKYKKVTYKSSNSAVVSVSSAGVIKATGKKGKAKITITSKQNKKKKVVITVKIGTRVNKIKFKSKTVKMEVGDSLRLGDKKFKLTYSPKKPTSKAVSLSSKNRKVATVNSYGILTARKIGKTTITATTKDGSGRKAKCTVKVSKVVLVTPTPPPKKNPDSRKKTLVENFESYAVGTVWNVTTAGFVKPVTATVVQDPTNSKNKVLKIAYDGKTQAYDVQPYFSVDLSVLPGVKPGAKLGDFVGINFKTKVESNSPDCTYKNIVCYFADKGKIEPRYFAGTNNEDQADEWHKYKNSKSMAEGKNEEYLDDDTGKKDNQKNFPLFYDAYIQSKSLKDASPGFSEAKDDKTVPFVERYLDFNKPLIKEPISGKSLLNNTSFDFMFGSTYSGAYVGGYYLNLYIDDINLLSNTTVVGLTGINLTDIKEVGVGLVRQIKASFTPADTTETDLIWKSSDEMIATVDESGNVTGVKEGNVTITASSKTKPNISKSVTLSVYKVGVATAPKDIDISKIIPVDDTVRTKTKSDVSATYTAGSASEDGLKLGFTQEDKEAVVIDLEEEIDFTAYNSLEIVAKTPGTLTVELYDSSLNKTIENWWENQLQGACYPFFNGSCTTRLEDGAFDINSANRTEETIRLGWNDWGQNGKLSSNFRKIRYIVLKANKAAQHPSGFTNTSKDADGKEVQVSKYNYLVKRITLSTKEAPKSHKTIALTEANESLLTKGTDMYTSVEFNGKDVVNKEEVLFTSFVSNDTKKSGIGFYIDTRTVQGENLAGSNSYSEQSYSDEVDISDYKYVKVEVKTDISDRLMLVGMTNSQAWPTSGSISPREEALGNLIAETQNRTGMRTIYFSLKTKTNFLNNRDFSKMDVLGLKSASTGSKVMIYSMTLVKGEPLIKSADKDTTFVVD